MAALAGAASSLKLVCESRWQMVTGDGSRPPSPVVGQSSSSALEMKTPEGITLTLHEGDITSQHVDVIVNATDSSLQLNVGQLSRSILEAGGKVLQDECRKRAPNGIKFGEVVVTRGGTLSCLFVVHGVVCTWTDKQCKEVLAKFVANGLAEAHKMNSASIAIPSVSTVDLGIPPDVVAEVMFDELCEFCRLHPHTKVRDVRFVVSLDDFETVKAFEKVFLNRSFAMSVMTAEGLKLSLCVSDLADEQVDVIVNSVDTTVQLANGAASRALLQRGGKRLQEQCKNNAPNGLKLGQVVVTSGCELQSPYVVHGVCCHWNKGLERCQQVLGKFVTNSFKVVDKKQLVSIAFPAIGTGDLQIPPRVLANVMVDELIKFSHQNKSTTLKDVRVILYFTDLLAMHAFKKVLRSRCSVLPDAPPALKDYFPLPCNWKAMKSKQFYLLEKLHANSAEYHIVETTFQSDKKHEIIMIERVQNPKLYRQYMVHKRDMLEHTDQSGKAERRLWHGTTKTAANGINIYGFNRSYSGANATVFGDGVYFAMESSYSASDTYSAPDNNGLKRMFLARVLTGKYTQGKSGIRVPPMVQGSSTVLYDSVVDDVSNPLIFVVFNDCQAYAEYLVTFK